MFLTHHVAYRAPLLHDRHVVLLRVASVSTHDGRLAGTCNSQTVATWCRKKKRGTAPSPAEHGISPCCLPGAQPDHPMVLPQVALTYSPFQGTCKAVRRVFLVVNGGTLGQAKPTISHEGKLPAVREKPGMCWETQHRLYHEPF
jgi:hypothetical protein